MSNCANHPSEGGHPDDVCGYCGLCLRCTPDNWAGHLGGACRQPATVQPVTAYGPGRLPTTGAPAPRMGNRRFCRSVVCVQSDYLHTLAEHR